MYLVPTCAAQFERSSTQFPSCTTSPKHHALTRTLRISRDLIHVTTPVERVLLVGAPLKRAGARMALDEHLRELERLADTAGAVVVGSLTQQLDRPHPGTYLGKGKIEELKALVAEKEATLIIFDDELSPSQGKNIEDIVGTRVVDRAELILDIFATRARSSEARMQVELAQMFVERLARARALERSAHEEGAFNRGGDGDEVA